jgi:hypothetical protein
VQDQHPNLEPGVTGGQRLVVGPEAEGEIIVARVILGDDQDFGRHQRGFEPGFIGHPAR